jgi:hypothetical protein
MTDMTIFQKNPTFRTLYCFGRHLSKANLAGKDNKENGKSHAVEVPS